MAVGVISTLMILIAAYRHFILRRVHSAWRTFNVYVNRHVVVMILLGFIWWCVVRTSALTEPSTTIRQQQTMLPDVAERLVGSSVVVRANIRWANSVPCQGIVGCLLGAVLALPASGRTCTAYPTREFNYICGRIQGESVLGSSTRAATPVRRSRRT